MNSKKFIFIVAVWSLNTCLSVNGWSASSVHSDFELRVEPAQISSALNRLLSDESRSLDIPMSDMTVPSPVAPISIRGINVHLNFHIPKPSSTDDPREWVFSTNEIGAQITVGEISASKEIEKIVNGIRIRIRIEAHCYNGILSLPAGAAHVSGNVRANIENGKIAFALKNFDAGWDPGSWQVTSLVCSGPEGFGDLVGEAAKYELRGISPFLGSIETALSNELDRLSETAMSALFEKATAANSNFEVAVVPESLTDGDGGSVLVSGVMKFRFPMIEPGQEIIKEVPFESLENFPGETTVNGATGSLVLPFQTIQELLSLTYQNNWLKKSFMASEFNGFKKFMKNRFLQFLLWTDLWHFKSNADFAIEASFSEEPLLGFPESWAPGTLQAEVDFPILLEVYATKKGELTHYIDFESKLHGVAQIVQEGREIRVNFNQKKVPIVKKWDPEYTKKYSTFKHVATKFVSKTLGKILTSQGFSFSIPTIKFADDSELVPLTWSMEGRNIRLYVAY